MTDYLTIPYRKHRVRSSDAFPRLEAAHYPLVDAEVCWNGHKVSCPTVLDTGTHFSLFPFSLGEQLGLDVAAGKKALIPPEEWVFFWNLEVTLENRISFPVYAGFSALQDARKVGLLGQIGFFDQFDVTFEQSSDRILLRVRSGDVRLG